MNLYCASIICTSFPPYYREFFRPRYNPAPIREQENKIARFIFLKYQLQGLMEQCMDTFFAKSLLNCVGMGCAGDRRTYKPVLRKAALCPLLQNCVTRSSKHSNRLIH